MNALTWTSEKPELTCECILLTASWVRDEWSFGFFQIVKVESDGEWYWGICNENGDEWGDYEDLHAQQYAVAIFPKPTT